MLRKRAGKNGVANYREGATLSARHVLSLIAVGAVTLLTASDVHAQATPVGAAPDVPSLAECQVETPELIYFPPETLQPVAATPAPFVIEPPTPFAPPAGVPTDAETTDAVTATVREVLACRNAGDFLRAFALFTPNLMAELFGGPATIDPEVILAAREGPRPVPEQRRLRLDGISDIVMLPDGRASAIVETSTNRRQFRDFLFFVRDPETGRWLIDSSVPID